ANQLGERRDEPLVSADRRHTMIGRDAASLSQTAIFQVELDQRLGMLGNKGDWCENDRCPVATGTPQLLRHRRTEPSQRADTALIAYPPIQAWSIERPRDRRGRGFNLPRVPIARPDDPERQDRKSTRLNSSHRTISYA